MHIPTRLASLLLASQISNRPHDAAHGPETASLAPEDKDFNRVSLYLSSFSSSAASLGNKALISSSEIINSILHPDSSSNHLTAEINNENTLFISDSPKSDKHDMKNHDPSAHSEKNCTRPHRPHRKHGGNRGRHHRRPRPGRRPHHGDDSDDEDHHRRPRPPHHSDDEDHHKRPRPGRRPHHGDDSDDEDHHKRPRPGRRPHHGDDSDDEDDHRRPPPPHHSDDEDDHRRPPPPHHSDDEDDHRRPPPPHHSDGEDDYRRPPPPHHSDGEDDHRRPPPPQHSNDEDHRPSHPPRRKNKKNGDNDISHEPNQHQEETPSDEALAEQSITEKYTSILGSACTKIGTFLSDGFQMNLAEDQRKMNTNQQTVLMMDSDL